MKELLTGGCFFEGPRWHAGAWWVSDLYSYHVVRVTPDGGSTIAAVVPNQPSGIGFMPDGSLLVVSMKDRQLLRQRGDGQLQFHADLKPVTKGFANDMIVDRIGRAYVGNFGFDLFDHRTPPAHACIAQVDPSGKATVAAEDLRFPNGMVITGDGRTLIVAESFGSSLVAFTIADDGTLSDRRIFATLGPAPAWDSIESLVKAEVIPDGCAIDAEDHVWMADALNGRALRIAPNGTVVDTVHTPTGMGCYACALGGLDGKTLLLCGAPDFSDVKRKAAREAVLYTTEVNVPRGAGLP